MAILNPTFLRQTQFDSASPAGTAVVVHRFDRVGEFELSVSRREQILHRVRVNVGPGPHRGEAGDGPSGPGRGPGAHGGHGPGTHGPGPHDAGEDPLAAKPPRPDQPDAPPLAAASLDVTTLLQPGTRPRELDALPSGGYLSITSSQPIPEHHLVVRADQKDDVLLDTRRLGSRSLFALTLIRPGRYRLHNAVTNAEATVVVNYPKVGKTPYRPPAPLEIQCTADGFGAGTFTIDPAQGIVFRFATESRIQVELVEPDDGPRADRPRPKASFRTPREPGANAG
jgi:hypothetical protein